MMVQGVGMIGDIAFGTSLQAVRNLDGTIQADTVAGPSWGNNRMLSTSMGSNALVLVPASIDVSLFSSNNNVSAYKLYRFHIFLSIVLEMIYVYVSFLFIFL
jgi:hypothetical protein